MRLHGTKRVILMLHTDCGAYGGLAAGFGNDPDAERLHHRGDLSRAADYLERAIPGLEIEGYFVDFEGVWAVERAAAV